jgi:methionyl-tRNA formyltransferase
MNIIFFGSTNFSLPSLMALLKIKHKVTCVVTQPDRQKGRGLHLEGTAVKTAAEELGIKLYQAEQINTAFSIDFLKDLKADLFVVIAYGQILSQEVLDIPRIFSLNIHASLLPKYRGAAPINWAIIKGEQNTGISVIKMVKEMDAGPLILQKTIQITEVDTAITLEDKLSSLAAESLLEILDCIEANNYTLTQQEENKVSFAPKLKKGDGRINWNKPVQDIYNLIRGCISWPGAFTYYKGKLLKIFAASFTQLPLPGGEAGSCPLAPKCGEIINVSKDGIVVAAKEGALVIKELQIEGKRRMKTEEFISGHKICVGEAFDKK